MVFHVFQALRCVCFGDGKGVEPAVCSATSLLFSRVYFLGLF